MSEKTHILFDLDGTLTDPKEGITKSVCYALKHYGIQVEDLDSLCPFIGPPLTDSYKKYYGFSDEQAREGILVYREYFSARGWKENKVYAGIKEMLQSLKESGRHLLLATSKPEVFALQILEHFGMAEYFECIGGADLAETRSRKEDVIGYVLERCGLSSDKEAVKRAIMVGDREYDVLGARRWGMESVGVLYGYGDMQEMRACRPDYLVETVEELKRLLLSL